MAVCTKEQERCWPDASGQSLRLLLVQILRDARRPMSVPELIEACETAGVVFRGRASKVVSDTLRWETRKSRVDRIARGRYRFGRMPRSTSWWLDQKMFVLRQRLAQLRRQATSVVPADDGADLGLVRRDEHRSMLL